MAREKVWQGYQSPTPPTSRKSSATYPQEHGRRIETRRRKGAKNTKEEHHGTPWKAVIFLLSAFSVGYNSAALNLSMALCEISGTYQFVCIRVHSWFFSVDCFFYVFAFLFSYSANNALLSTAFCLTRRHEVHEEISNHGSRGFSRIEKQHRCPAECILCAFAFHFPSALSVQSVGKTLLYSFQSPSALLCPDVVLFRTHFMPPFFSFP